MSDLAQGLECELDHHWRKVVMIETEIHKAVKVANNEY